MAQVLVEQLIRRSEAVLGKDGFELDLAVPDLAEYRARNRQEGAERSASEARHHLHRGDSSSSTERPEKLLRRQRVNESIDSIYPSLNLADGMEVHGVDDFRQHVEFTRQELESTLTELWLGGCLRPL